MVEPADRKKTGTLIRWRPDIEVFTDIDIPEEHFASMLCTGRPSSTRASLSGCGYRKTASSRRAISSTKTASRTTLRELAGENPLTQPEFISAERKGRDREDKPEYKVKLSAAFCFRTA